MPETGVLEVQGRRLPIRFRRHARARHYVLRLLPDQTLGITLPLHGSRKFAEEFAASRKVWIQEQWQVLEARRLTSQELQAGMTVLVRGEAATLVTEQVDGVCRVRLGEGHFTVPSDTTNLQPAAEAFLQQLAGVEVVTRVRELALQQAAPVRKIVIRNQKSRWGSCSHNGTISLNWRLIQVPPGVRDYIILHELTHLRFMNHSPAFWAAVAQVCPDYLEAEAWLKANAKHVGL